MGKNTDRNYEALVEDYEDARMRLIAYQAAQEGGGGLGQAAGELEEFGLEAPGERRLACGEIWQGFGYRLYTAMRAVVIATLAASLVFCAAFGLHEGFRVGVLNFLLELRESGMWFSRPGGTEGGAGRAQGEFPFEFTYIPDGYELFDREIYVLGADEEGYYCGYFTTEDPPHQFYFDISPVSEGTGLFVDTENAVVTEMTIHGHDGWRIEKTEFTSQRAHVTYFWMDLEKGYTFHYSSVGISPEENQKIFDGIVMSGLFDF